MTGVPTVTLSIEFERETDGRWIADIPELPGVMAYGATREESMARAQALALRVIADQVEHRGAGSELVALTFRARASNSFQNE